MIRPIGDRVLVRPIPVTSNGGLIVFQDTDPPVTAEIISVGKSRCPVCAAPLNLVCQPGMRIALRPTAIYQEVVFNGETLWMVNLADVIGEVLPEETHA